MNVPEFVIPLTKDQLLQPVDGHYYVQTLVPLRDVTKKLQDVRGAIQQHGPKFILDHFGDFFSILIHSTNLDVSIFVMAFERIHKSLGILVEKLEKNFEAANELSREDKSELLNVTKMHAYLYSSLICHIENQIYKNDIGMQTKKKKSSNKSDLEHNWERQIDKALILIYQWIQLPLHKLWQPPIMEEAFVTLLAEVCYKVLENCKETKEKHVRETTFQILGSLIKKYSHGLTSVVRIVQLVKIYDGLAPFLAAGIIQIIEETGNTGLIKEIVREVERVDPDEGGSKNIAIFLETISSSKPNLIIPVLDNLTDHLSNECYLMRNCVIGILGAVVKGALTGDDLSQEQRDIRDECLRHLKDHFLDCNAYVRSKTIQVWQYLSSEGAVPLTWQNPLLEATTSRLQDKGAVVRKNAYLLLRTLLQGNPYAAKFDRDELRRQLQEAKEKLSHLQRDIISESAPNADDRIEYWNTMESKIKEAVQAITAKEVEESLETDLTGEDLDDAFEKIRHLLLAGKIKKGVKLAHHIVLALPDAPKPDALTTVEKETYFLAILHKIVMESNDTSGKDEETAARKREKQQRKAECEAQNRLVTYIQNSSEFADKLDEAIVIAEKWLLSSTASDAVEACTFLGLAVQFGFERATPAIHKALMLLNYPDVSVNETVAKVYKGLYFGEDGQYRSERPRALAAVTALMKLLEKLGPGESPALEKLIVTWQKNKVLDAETVKVMWERFALKITGTTALESRGALMLLTMAATAEPDILIKNMNTLVKVGLGDRASDDLLLARDTCRALSRFRLENPDPTIPPLRYPNTHEVFKCIVKLLVDSFSVLSDEGAYPSFSTDAINAIYQLADQPGAIMKDILCQVTTKMNAWSGNQGDTNKVPAWLLARFLHLVGHTAIREMVHLDTAVFKEIKRRENLAELKKQKQSSKEKRGRSHIVSTPPDARSSASRLLRNKENSVIEDSGEEALQGTSAEDADAEFIYEVTENEILSSDGFLGKFVPLVLKVCQHPDLYPDARLQESATLALSKMATVSSHFCGTWLQLLVTIMERSQYPTVRANILLGLSDMIKRFPNEVEPWTKHIYGRLRDEEPRVRRTCVKMLSNLIMREMIRVKGQVSELAICLLDDEPDIQADATQFFVDLADKGNALYNIMPDILSRLADPDLNLEEDQFQQIIKFILGLLKKEKQVDSIIEKLCVRFKLATTERQWRDLSYCLSLLHFNAKGIRRLITNLPLLKEKLHHKPVLKALRGIIDQTKKKAEAKTACLELEEKVEQILSGLEETEEPDVDALVMPPPKTVPRQKKTNKKTAQAESSSEEENESSENSDDEDDVFDNEGASDRRSNDSRSSDRRKTANSETSRTPRGKKTVDSESKPEQSSGIRKKKAVPSVPPTPSPRSKRNKKMPSVNDSEASTSQETPIRRSLRNSRGDTPMQTPARSSTRKLRK